MLHNKLGLVSHDAEKAFSGYTIFSPMGRPSTFLINMKGDVVHEWELPVMAGNYAYLLPNGNLLAAQRTPDGPADLPGKGGKLIEMDWDGNILWEFTDHFQNHDFRRCANGNTVYAAWEVMPEEAAARVQGGRAGTEHKNGIYGEMFVAAMLAHAAVSENIEEITKVGLSEIPAECRLSAEITRVLNWYSEGSLNGQTAMEKVLTEYDEELKYHWAHTIPNAMLVCIALLWGNKNFDSTMFLAVSCGFDTDCNGATAGSILGMILGAGAIPEKWTQPLNDRIISAVNGYEISRISELASRTLDYL